MFDAWSLVPLHQKTGPGPSLEVRYSQIKIEANADPLKLLDQISTNHKDIVLKERSGNVEPAQPERKEPEINYNICSHSEPGTKPTEENSPNQKSLPSKFLNRVSLILINKDPRSIITLYLSEEAPINSFVTVYCLLLGTYSIV
ncbi:hypothetical protein PSTG_17326 [Puccinia striiformis f. sp. tritici PST-78]|uniref:Uncharacterized protein n=1 Tax=Puccinia striiformis f. sp. tritici PST-78 TaxID=1165861 RepID=A0A0L0UQA4_9BASI|nr:hypothetical protein PSTG_17326 [Puccinia striiformis f. sp. tritici PST-78]